MFSADVKKIDDMDREADGFTNVCFAVDGEPTKLPKWFSIFNPF